MTRASAPAVVKHEEHPVSRERVELVCTLHRDEQASADHALERGITPRVRCAGEERRWKLNVESRSYCLRRDVKTRRHGALVRPGAETIDVEVRRSLDKPRHVPGCFQPRPEQMRRAVH